MKVDFFLQYLTVETIAACYNDAVSCEDTDGVEKVLDAIEEHMTTYMSMDEVAKFNKITGSDL